MKKFTNIASSVKDGKLTITGDVVECLPHEFKFPAQQVTISHTRKNSRHVRHIHASNEGVFVKWLGATAVIPSDDFVAIAAAIEPLTASKPWFNSNPSPNQLTVEVSSEIEPNFQWKWSNDNNPNGKWTDIQGANTSTLTKTPELAGKWVACVAYSEAGATSTTPIQI